MTGQIYFFTQYQFTPTISLIAFADQKHMVKIEFREHHQIKKSLEQFQKNTLDSILQERNHLLTQFIQELDAYLAGTLFQFTVPYKITKATTFQKQTWNTLKEIPYGTTASYKDIALKLNNQKAMRAVGNANNRNHFPLIIPCHRVIQSNGAIGGYAGGSNIKKFLLEHEAKFHNQTQSSKVM